MVGKEVPESLACQSKLPFNGFKQMVIDDLRVDITKCQFYRAKKYTYGLLTGQLQSNMPTCGTTVMRSSLLIPVQL